MTHHTAHRLALATTDRLTIYKHFGQADEFQIVDIDAEGGYTFIESRKVVPACSRGEHSEDGFDAVLDLLSDCEALIVGKIGPGAAEYVTTRGIRVFQGAGTVEKILSTLISKKMLDKA
ncbi:MAG: dinitrogenase iron-molybdenum cofactor biosynthesis protein [Clostridiales Family XIII bacterium]|nr:dinitrogenase iron-molybdenum cofactor biosynthesis protein [Clostridiales Family XIII bacterium]